MGTTTPDNIFFPDTSTTWATTADFSVLASSTQDAFKNRQRYTYRWNNATERGAQTSMRQGDTGYQIDTRSEYVYDNSAWRLNTPYGEFTSASATLNSTAFTNFGTISISSGNSTSTTFATPSANTITIADPGVYAINLFCNVSVTGGAGFATTAIASDYSTNFASQIGRAPFGTIDNVASNTSFYRFAASGGILYFAWKQGDTASRAYTATIRVIRLA